MRLSLIGGLLLSAVVAVAKPPCPQKGPLAGIADEDDRAMRMFNWDIAGVDVSGLSEAERGACVDRAKGDIPPGLLKQLERMKVHSHGLGRP